MALQLAGRSVVRTTAWRFSQSPSFRVLRAFCVLLYQKRKWVLWQHRFYRCWLELIGRGTNSRWLTVATCRGNNCSRGTQTWNCVRHHDDVISSSWHTVLVHQIGSTVPCYSVLVLSLNKYLYWYKYLVQGRKRSWVLILASQVSMSQVSMSQCLKSLSQISKHAKRQNIP